MKVARREQSFIFVAHSSRLRVGLTRFLEDDVPTHERPCLQPAEGRCKFTGGTYVEIMRPAYPSGSYGYSQEFRRRSSIRPGLGCSDHRQWIIVEGKKTIRTGRDPRIVSFI